jgi:hypothetical protein
MQTHGNTVAEYGAGTTHNSAACLICVTFSA